MANLLVMASIVLLSLVLPLWASMALGRRRASRTTVAAVWAGQMCLAYAGIQLVMGAGPLRCLASAIAGALFYGFALRNSLVSRNEQGDEVVVE